MKRFIPYVVLLLAILWLGKSWAPPKPKAGDFDTRAFSRLPVLAGGRIKPLDTVARNSLLIMRGKQTLRLEDGSKMEASRWLTDVLFNAPVADTYPVFAIANPEVLGMFGMPQADKRYCTFAELKPYISQIEEEGIHSANIEGAKRTPFQTAIYNLRNSLILYQRLKSGVHPEDATEFAAEVNTYAEAVAAGAAALEQGKTLEDKTQFALLKTSVSRYESQAEFANMLIVAPAAGGGVEDWMKTGSALIRVKSPQSVPASVAAFADMSDAFRAGDHAAFDRVDREYAGWM